MTRSRLAVARDIQGAAYDDSAVCIPVERILLALMLDGGEPLSPEDCRVFVMGEDPTGEVPPRLAAAYPQTHALLDELLT
jgi:hypothetical protein